MTSIWEELGKAGEYDQNTLHEILKDLIKMRKNEMGKKVKQKQL